ncbi:MAG: hypothetical protein WCS88_04200 [Patescibacteria group bacterium]|jgi:hypothetical protein
MKKEYISIFLLIIAILLGIIFYFNSRPVENKNILQYTVGCASDKIDASVYSLEGNTSRIGALISFNDVPISEETRAELTKLGVILSEDSWIFDYALAEIPTESLCALADYDFVQSVFIPKTN